MGIKMMNYDYLCLHVGRKFGRIFSDIINAYFLDTGVNIDIGVNESTFKLQAFNSYIEEHYGIRLFNDITIPARGRNITVDDIIILDEKKYMMFLLRK
jgi:hypothetical protein